MTITEMIAEWRRGCSNSTFDENGVRIDQTARPALCECCTVALIEAIEAKLKRGAQ